MFRPVLESFEISLYSSGPPGGEVNNARVGSQRYCFVMSLLSGDAFSCGVMRWTVYPTPYTGLWLTAPGRGAGPTCRTSSGLVVLIVGDVYCGKGSFPVCRYLMEDLSFSVPAHGILHIVNGFLPGNAYLLAASWCYLDVFLRHSNVGRRWWWITYLSA
jgi:hypothetical protein